jgi:hypothetical protein
MVKLNSFIISVLLFISIFAVAEIAILVNSARKTVKEATAAMVEIRQTLSEVHAYTTKQISNLESQQKSINASIQAAAVFNGTGRLLNTQTIPRVNKTLDSLNQSIVSINSMVKNTDTSLNMMLVPQITETAKAFNVSVITMNDSIVEITKQSSLTIQAVRDTMASDEWREVLENVASTTEHIDGISKNIEETTSKMPAMAELVEKMMKTTSKYQKALLLSQILSYILRIF